MNNLNKAVIGLGFGDEGKGHTVDYLASKNKDALVVRYSGGQQAGHTVHMTENKKHVFSSFGSGTWRGCPTYISPYCTISPRGILNEYDALEAKGIKPKLYIDADCPVTTPYDISKNRELSGNKYNTCGLGVGQTWQREEDFYHLHFSDLFNKTILKEKLKNIKRYYDVKDSHPLDKHYRSDIEFYEDVYEILVLVEEKVIELTYGQPSWPGASPIIFEGSQGLLLDQHIGFFPDVTRSNTGTKNIVEMTGVKPEEIELYLVTRCYQTRHGSGFMTNTDIPTQHIIKPWEGETNKFNHHQGEFKRTILDLDLLEYAINKDPLIRNTKIRRTLVITCLDQMKEFHFTYKGVLHQYRTAKHSARVIGQILGISDILLSSDKFSVKMRKLV